MHTIGARRIRVASRPMSNTTLIVLAHNGADSHAGVSEVNR